MSTAYDVPHDGPVDSPPLARQPSCPLCSHEAHTPVRCEISACDCTVVPTPGVL
jgi:hypothetical protein